MIRQLLRSYGLRFMVAASAGAISGIAASGLIAVINQIQSSGQLPFGIHVAAAFLILLIVAPLGRLLSQALLIHIGQVASLDLRMQLSSRILSAELKEIEAIGSHRLMSVLVGDTAA